MSGDQPQPSNALKRWELENNVQEASASDMDALYRYDAAEQKAIQESKPWKSDPHYFKRWGGRAGTAATAAAAPLVVIQRPLALAALLQGADISASSAQDGHACQERRQHRGHGRHAGVGGQRGRGRGRGPA